MLFLTALVALIDFCSNLFRNRLITLGEIKRKFNFVKFSYVLAVVLIIGSWVFIFVADKADFFGLFTEKNLMITKKIIRGLLGINDASPAFLNRKSLVNALERTYETLQMSIMAIHNFGILGKLCVEVVADLDLRPVRNLASCGGNSYQMIFYGEIPMGMPKFITYILYRGEVILRTTIVVGFVGAGGLGKQFKLSMSYFKYTEITLILLCYLLLVVFADLLSDWSRKLSE